VVEVDEAEGEAEQGEDVVCCVLSDSDLSEGE